MRTKLRSAIQQASQENARIVVAGGRTNHNGVDVSFSIDVQPVLSDGEELLLICFVDEPKHEQEQGHPVSPRDASRIAELEQELEATRTELQGPSAISRFPARSRRRSTKKRCPSMRNTNRPTRSC